MIELTGYIIYFMCKRYINAQCRNVVRRLDLLDLNKVHYAKKKKTPPLPRDFDEDLNDDGLKSISPTGTSISLEEAVQNMTDSLC